MIDASVLIVGGGAVGGVLAGRMTGSVRRVAVLDADAEHVRRMRDGLSLDVLGEERAVAIEAYDAPDDVRGPFDFALVAVKAPAIESAVSAVHARALADVYVSLGNGIVQDRLAAIVGGDRLIAGTVELGATNLGPGRVRQTTANPFVIGELDGATRPRTRRLAQVLGTVEPVHVTANIAGQIWSKLLVNSTFSGLGVVGGCLYGDVVASREGRRAAIAIWSEGHRVADALGLALEPVLGVEPFDLTKTAPPAVADRALEQVARTAGATRASMLQDVERGRRTEVDVINGAVVDYGRRYAVLTPANAAVVALVHAFENGAETPSTAHFARVLGALAGQRAPLP